MRSWWFLSLCLPVVVLVSTAGCFSKAEKAPESKPGVVAKKLPTAQKEQPERPGFPVEQATATKATEASVKASPGKTSKPKKKVVRSWDFATLSKEQWEWQFPEQGLRKTKLGAQYRTWNKQPGPRWFPDDLSADQVSAIRLHIGVWKNAPAGYILKVTTLPQEPRLLWANPDDLKEGQDLFFVRDKRVPFRRVDAKNPSLWEARVKGHKTWHGKIAGMYVAVPVPKDLDKKTEPPYNVVVRRIEFMK